MADPQEEFESFQSALRERSVPETFIGEAPVVTTEEPVIPPTAPQEVEEPGQEGRARDEKGRFIPQAQPEPETPLILGRFKSHEELAKSYQELEREFTHRSQELTRLQGIEERLTGLEGRQPEQQWDVRTQSVYDHMLEENPGQAAYMALQRGDQALYQHALTAWGEQDPFGAARFDDAYQRQLLAQTLERRWEERYAPKIEQLAQKGQEQEQMQTLAAVAQQYGLNTQDFGAAILSAAEKNPDLVSSLQPGNPKAMFETLYKLHRLDELEAVTSSVDTVKVQQAEEAKRVRKEAAVATASSHVAEEEKSPHDRLRERIVAANPFPSVQEELKRTSPKIDKAKLEEILKTF